MKALIVDDNPEYAEMLKLGLAKLCQADVARNGTEAFKLFCEALKGPDPYVVIILDVNMPLRDGYETVRSIRLMERNLFLVESMSAKIILVTGHPEEIVTKRALSVGAQAIISKSEGLAPLVAKVTELTGSEPNG